MGWTEKAWKLGESIKQQETERVAIGRKEKERIKQEREEHERIVKEFGPRVKKVCKIISESIGGELSTDHLFLGPPPSCFIVSGSKDEYGCRNGCTVMILSEGIKISTTRYTESFFSRCSPVESGFEPSLGFYRQLQRIHFSSDSDENWWAVYYFIPPREFTDDRLGEALSTLLEEALSKEGTIFPEER